MELHFKHYKVIVPADFVSSKHRRACSVQHWILLPHIPKFFLHIHQRYSSSSIELEIIERYKAKIKGMHIFLLVKNIDNAISSFPFFKNHSNIVVQETTFLAPIRSENSGALPLQIPNSYKPSQVSRFTTSVNLKTFRNSMLPF